MGSCYYVMGSLECGFSGDLAGVGGPGEQVHPVEFAAGVAPGVAGGVLDHPQEQQREPAQLDVGGDAVLGPL